jgi:transcriptional regulator of acetoin/glycerol metabolism
LSQRSISCLRSAVHDEESWRTLLQCFRTKIFLASSDEFTARVAAELCGRAERLKPSDPLREIEREHMLAALDRSQGNRMLTAQQLDVAPATLFRKLNGYANGQLTLLAGGNRAAPR